MRCPNCGRSRGVSQHSEWDDSVYYCKNCDTWFLVDVDGNTYISTFEELCEMAEKFSNDDDDNDYFDNDDDDDDDDDDSDFNSQRATYVWRGCSNCGKWDDWNGCRDGLEKGDWCRNPDFW